MKELAKTIDGTLHQQLGELLLGEVSSTLITLGTRLVVAVRAVGGRRPEARVEHCFLKPGTGFRQTRLPLALAHSHLRTRLATSEPISVFEQFSQFVLEAWGPLQKNIYSEARTFYGAADQFCELLLGGGLSPARREFIGQAARRALIFAATDGLRLLRAILRS